MSNAHKRTSFPGPWWSQDGVASAALDPPVRASHQDQGLPERVVITMLHQSATGRKRLLWGGLDPSGLRLRLLQNRSVTQRVWVWVTEYSFVPRYPYPVPRIRMCNLHNLISVFGDRVHGVSLDHPSPRETYLDTQIFICLLFRLHLPLRLCPVLSALGPSLYLSIFPSSTNHQPLRHHTNLIFSSISHKPHNGRFCSRCCQGHQVRA